MKDGYTNRDLIPDLWKKVAAEPQNKQLSRELSTLIFSDTMNIISSSERLQTDIQYSIEGTIVSNDFVSMYDKSTKESKGTMICVSEGRTIASARNFVEQGYKVAVLNFASATHPGGQVTTGSSAQEESICRVSTLYPVLTSDAAKKYYITHKRNLNKIKPYYTNNVIYSPNITVFKPDVAYPDRKLNERDWFHVDVITSPAPNLINQKINYNMLEIVLKSRIDNILAAAAVGGANVIILGAFGCGVFKNPPELVAKCFKEVIDMKWNDVFDVILFAIINDARGKNNIETFINVLV